ncbi:hypothetical protein [Bacillus ndiopicus]|uniref:hypothetical protein n=1 Tax=Bacillus ndiopicus TaxID=1347368 RepID=UPI000A70B491|nr:hypothetical protein [Bacillus ndiopicus]
MKKFFASLLVCFAVLVSVSGYQAPTETAANDILLKVEFQAFSKELPDLPSIH